MSGNRLGGLKARDTNKERYGKSFYSDAGKIGGSRSIADGAKPKGFASETIGKDGMNGRARARIAGKLGGSRRWKKNE